MNEEAIKMNAKEMASLFDFNVEETLEESSPVATEPQNFEQRCEDVQSIMVDESDKLEVSEGNADTEIIQKALSDSGTHPAEPENKSTPEISEEDIPGDVTEKTVEPEPEKTSKEEPAAEPEVSATPSENEENPLQLYDSDLESYNQIKERFPQFNLYDGTRAFRDFYRHKFFFLKSMLTRFKMLDLGDMNAEIQQVNMNHTLDSDLIDPQQISNKLSSCYRERVRIAELLIHAYEQFHSWKEQSKILKSFLFKEHELRGAHRREGLAMEHLSDVDGYVHDMEGFIESAKHIDSMLKAASDSLSRQLTCLQLKHQVVASPKVEQSSYVKRENEGFDHITEGSNIGTPKPKGATSSMDFGVNSDDDFANLG